MVAATLNFITDLDRYETEKPYFLNIVGHKSLPTVLQTNLEYTPHDGVEIEDIRGPKSESFSLEENSFKFLKYEAVSSLEDGDAAVEAYCDEIVRLVAKECNAAHAICYDYRVSSIYLTPSDQTSTT